MGFCVGAEGETSRPRFPLEWGLSGYDAEFVVLARTLGVPLVSLAGEILTAEGTSCRDGPVFVPTCAIQSPRASPRQLIMREGHPAWLTLCLVP